MLEGGLFGAYEDGGAVVGGAVVGGAVVGPKGGLLRLSKAAGGAVAGGDDMARQRKVGCWGEGCNNETGRSVPNCCCTAVRRRKVKGLQAVCGETRSAKQ